MVAAMVEASRRAVRDFSNPELAALIEATQQSPAAERCPALGRSGASR